MQRIAALVLAFAFLVPAVAGATEPTDAEIARAVAEMPMPNLERHLEATAAKAKAVHHTRAKAAPNDAVRRGGIVLANNRPR